MKKNIKMEAEVLRELDCTFGLNRYAKKFTKLDLQKEPAIGQSKHESSSTGSQKERHLAFQADLLLLIEKSVNQNRVLIS